uniref:Uncharacterized protein n=1 Tax=Ditylenchus dipsaci TaxID=166011 RepID=A0A915CQ72_9BILA
MELAEHYEQYQKEEDMAQTRSRPRNTPTMLDMANLLAMELTKNYGSTSQPFQCVCCALKKTSTYNYYR